MNEINISYNHNFEFPLVKKNLKDYCRKVLDHNNYKSSLISLIFIDQEELREMKKLYFKEDAYTDVIAFNFNKNEDTLTFDTLGIGDVSVSFIDDDASPADTIISFDNNPDWGSIVLVDVGRLDKDELNIDTDATVGGLG